MGLPDSFLRSIFPCVIYETERMWTFAPIFLSFNCFRQNLEVKVTFTFYFCCFGSNFPCTLFASTPVRDAETAMAILGLCWPLSATALPAFPAKCFCRNQETGMGVISEVPEMNPCCKSTPQSMH